MSDVFDTPFEMSLRLLLFLSADESVTLTCDMLALVDTICVYGGNFEIADENLHGDNDYVLDEFDMRRELIKTALKHLVLRGLVNVSKHKDGFRYSVSDAGRKYCTAFDSDYAAEYLELAKSANRFIKGKTECEVFALMSRLGAINSEGGH